MISSLLHHKRLLFIQISTAIIAISKPSGYLIVMNEYSLQSMQRLNSADKFLYKVSATRRQVKATEQSNWKVFLTRPNFKNNLQRVLGSL
ncbi:Uncharacterized protein HZ326_3218 [Fusarium oxysporum f. sp. albedinis]|nr:Uncharacterized protein HZ326_3218 [Fusarium oxysporum f. sp. albedinis]